MSKKALLALILTVCLIFTSCRIPGFSDIDLGPLFPQGGDGGDALHTVYAHFAYILTI